MTAEAPKSSGITAPVAPLKSEGGFSRFMRRALDFLSDQPSTQTPIPRIVQPPPGLENFATNFQQGISNHFAAKRQQEIEQQNAEAIRLATEAERSRLELERYQKAEEPERLRREKALAETAEILKRFQVAEKLEYIRLSQWGGKGEVKPVEPEFDINQIYRRSGSEDRLDRLGGFQLTHYYPYYTSRTKQEDTGDSAVDYNMLVPETAFGYVYIAIYSRQIFSGEVNKEFWVSSSEAFGSFINIPIDEAGNSWIFSSGSFTKAPIGEPGALLDSTLAQETAYRIDRHRLPADVEKEKRAMLLQAQQSPDWKKWVRSGR